MGLRRRDERVESLRAVPLFGTFTTEELREVARHADEITVSAGETLTEEGGSGQEAFLLLEGSVEVLRGDTKLADRGPGAFIGEMSLIDGGPRSATVLTTADCRLLVMHRRDFISLLERVPELERKLLVELARRVREADQRLV